MFYLLYLLSGAGGAIFEVAWARQYGDVFGNTVHSTLLLTTVFLLGWGAGGYLCGAWSARGLVSVLLPNLGVVSSLTAFYSRNSTGWYSLSLFSSLSDEFRAAIRLMPKSVEAHNNLGIALGRKGRLEEAVNQFQEALKLDPNPGRGAR